jgi:hypothetical protein
MSKTTKQKVFVVSCPETDLGNVHITTGTWGIGDLIEGDIENNPGITEFNYTVQVKMMTQKQIDDLPEYEP